MPPDDDDVVKEALPLASETLPSVVVPSLNVTVPVGVSAVVAVGTTVAVNVTAWPYIDGFSDDFSEVEV